MALLVGYIADEGGWHDRTALQTAVLGAVIFDLIFGMFTVSTATANAWYHRAGADARRFRFAFASGHLCYLVAGAALFDTGNGRLPTRRCCRHSRSRSNSRPRSSSVSLRSAWH